MFKVIKAYKTSDGSLHSNGQLAAKIEIGIMLDQLINANDRIAWLNTNLHLLQDCVKIFNDFSMPASTPLLRDKTDEHDRNNH